MKKLCKFVSGLCTVAGIAFLSSLYLLDAAIPDKINILEGEEFSLPSVPAITANLPAETPYTSGDSYQVDVKLFGSIPVKQVTVSVYDRTSLIPSGRPFGLKMFTEGVLVVGLCDIDTDLGPVSPASQAGLKAGDILLSIDGQEVDTNEQVAFVLSHCNGKPINLQVKRGEKLENLSLTPALSRDGLGYRGGFWVRDSSAGIGTLTFIDPVNQVFGGLGHGVCDIDTGDLLPLRSGEIVPSAITDVVKATPGTPGELRGQFVTSEEIGKLAVNCDTGVYGPIQGEYAQGDPVPIGLKQTVHTGDATILSTLEGSEPQEYTIQIERISLNDESNVKNMVIRVTDPRLLAKTGGIVQGMSGSPILQDGHLIGAVTHVFVGDPSKGYAIFIENMLSASHTAGAAL